MLKNEWFGLTNDKAFCSCVVVFVCLKIYYVCREERKKR